MSVELKLTDGALRAIEKLANAMNRLAAAAEAGALPAGPRRAILRSPERDALIRREWTAGVSVHATFERWNALPGSPLPSAQRLAVIANQMRLSRPPGWDFKRAPQTVEEACMLFPVEAVTHQIGGSA